MLYSQFERVRACALHTVGAMPAPVVVRHGHVVTHINDKDSAQFESFLKSSLEHATSTACREEKPSLTERSGTAMVDHSALVFSAVARIRDAVAQSSKAPCKDGHRVVQHLRGILDPKCPKSKKSLKAVRLLFMVADGIWTSIP